MKAKYDFSELIYPVGVANIEFVCKDVMIYFSNINRLYKLSIGNVFKKKHVIKLISKPGFIDLKRFCYEKEEELKKAFNL